MNNENIKSVYVSFPKEYSNIKSIKNKNLKVINSNYDNDMESNTTLCRLKHQSSVQAFQGLSRKT
jgi:hypothetical protein